MRTWIVNVWDSFRTGFWFFPTLLIVAAVFLAIVVPEIDRAVGSSLPDWMKSTGTTARGTLSALASAMFTVAGVVFSVTVVTLSLTSSQFGSRLLRNFLEQSITQITMGSCLASSIYCLLLLWRVDDVDGDWFVPHIGVFLGTVLALVTLCLVVYFIHRVAHSVQSMNVVTDVAADLDAAIDRIFPRKDEASEAIGRMREELAKRFAENEGEPVLTHREGYLQAVNTERLCWLADQHQLLIRVTYAPGAFVVAGERVAYFLREQSNDDDLADELARGFLFGNRRTPRQDVECAISELSELAVRALSPGINDPHTATATIDRLSAALCRLAECDVTSTLRVQVGEGDQLRVLGPQTSFDAVLRAAFDEIRQYGATSVAVSIRLLEALERIAHRAGSEAERSAVARQADLVLEGCEQQSYCSEDLRDVRDRHQAVVQLCAPHKQESKKTSNLHVGIDKQIPIQT